MAGYNFKDENDVKQYLENLHTEYKFGCYSEKNPEVCHLLGDYYESVKTDFKAAAEIYQKNCDNLEYGRSCAKFGGYSMIGKGCKTDINKAYKYMKKGCELNDMVGCTNGGIISLTNKEIQSEDRLNTMKYAIQMLQKGCDNKTERACFFLTGAYLAGIENVVEKSMFKAYECSLKACEYGNPNACNFVSQMHERGEEGVQKNADLAKVFRNRAIELEKESREQQRQVEFGQGIKT